VEAAGVIAFGVSIGEAEPYRRFSEPGIGVAAEPDSEIYAFAATGPGVSRTYNLMLGTAARRDDLEALVLLHSHTEIVDTAFCAKVREALRDPDVAVVGCVGAAGVGSIAWWEGAVRSGPVLHRYAEYGSGEVPAFAWARPEEPGEVDTVDGFLMVLSPWAVRNVRFDEALLLSYGFDLDFCLQVREAGRKVVTADLAAVFHRSLELVSERELWIEAHIDMAEKWEGRMLRAEGGEVDWKQRARRAEAEREVARALAHSNLLGADAKVQELERAVEEVTETVSWRATEPLRRVNAWRAERSRRRRR
jgi:Glycosyltransferase like family